MALSDAVASAVANWPLDEASGNAVETINGYTGTESGTVGTDTGKVTGSARDFEAGDANDYFEVADTDDLSPVNNKFMIRAWVKFESLGAIREIISKSDAGSGEWFLYYDSAVDRIIFELWSGSGFSGHSRATWSSAPSTGTWYLVHAWHDPDADVIGIAVDAGTAVTDAHNAGVFETTGVVRIGRDIFSNNADGLINDVVILKGYILDATERTEDYNGGTGVAFSDWDAGGGGLSIPIAAYHYNHHLVA